MFKYLTLLSAGLGEGLQGSCLLAITISWQMAKKKKKSR